MKQSRIIFSYLLIFTFILSGQSCKYKNGPLISFRSKKARLDGKWKLEKEFINGQETKGQDLIIAQESTGVIEFTKGGDYIVNDPDTGEQYQMHWEWASNKKKLKIIYPEGDYSYIKILRLRNNSLWLKEEVGTSSVESHYVPA